MRTKKGQSGANAGVVVIIVTILIILYILFLPPAEREDLLSGGTGTGGHSTSGSGTSGTGTNGAQYMGIVLKENVGTLYELSEDQKDYEMSSFTIGTKTSAGIIKSASAVYVKSSAFQETRDTVRFEVDPDLTDNLILSFNVDAGLGRLLITLNGNTIFNKELGEGSSPPIYLDSDDLENTNELVFSVSGPGLAFWRYNEYSIEDIKITGDQTDISGSEAVQYITLSNRDLEQVKSSRVRYLASCTERNVKNFELRFNGDRLFRGTPDCAVYTYLPIDKEDLIAGKNEFEFRIEEGSVLVDRLQLENKLEDPDYPVFYFELNKDIFLKQKDDDYCGKVDGICPSNCEGDEDVDCCFKRRDNYWCDVETDNLNDRCVSFVNDCNRCASGYEDRTGDPPDKCADEEYVTVPYCGDDTDDICPAGCTKYYDKDCCFADGEENFWCSSIPEVGITSVCEESIEDEECNDCYGGYEDKDGHRPDCSNVDLTDDTDYQEELKDGYDIILDFRFSNNDQKKLEIFVNGRKIGVNTAQESYERDISSYVESGTNSIELRPENDLTITEMRVTVK